MFSKFSPEELQKIREAAELLDRYKYSDVFGDVSGALQKVLDFIELHSGDAAGSVYDFIDPEKQPQTSGSEWLSRLLDAIRNQKAVRLYYQPFYEEKPYFADIHPYLLKEHRSRWYLIGLNDFREQLRTYALDRIHDLQESDVKFRPGALKASDYFRHSIGVIAPGGAPPKTRIAVQKTQAQYLISRPWHGSQNIEEENDDEVIFSFRVHHTYEFISLLLGLGKDLRILEPDSLIEKVADELTVMLQNLGKAGE